MAVVVALLVLTSGVSSRVTAQDPKKGSVVVHFVGKGLLNQKSVNVLQTIQLGSTGQFLGIDGCRLPEKDLKGIFIVEKDKDSRAFSELVVTIVAPEETSVTTLLRAVELLKQAAPAGVATTIYLRT